MPERSDTDLVVAAIGGDQLALAGIYDRYADSVYSFSMSRLRHREQAADATHETFVRVATRLGTLRDPSRLKAWIFAIARNQITDQARSRARTTTLEEGVDMAAVQPDNDANLLAADSAQLLWDAADGLTDRDVELLELSLRHGLEGPDLADALGVTTSHLHVLQSRVRDRVGKSLGALLVARHGRDDCKALADLLRDWDGTFTIATRSQVTRHVERCGICSETHKSVVTPGRFAAVLPLTAAPEVLRFPTLDAMTEALRGEPIPGQDAEPEGSQSWREDGFPEAPVEVANRAGANRVGATSRRGAWLFRTAVALLVIAMVIAAIAWLTDDPDDSGASDATATSQDLASPTSLSPTAPDPTTPSTTIQNPTDPIPTTAPTSPETTATPTPPVTPPPTAPPAPGDTTPPTIFRVAVQQPICANVPIEVSAFTDDDVEVTSVDLVWSDDDGSGSVPMIQDAADGPWQATVPRRQAGTINFTVTASDEAGNVASQVSSAEVRICPG